MITGQEEDFFHIADRQIRSIWSIEQGRGKRNMLLGMYAAHLKKRNEFAKYGYADEAAYRDAVGISRSCWGRYTRIASFFVDIVPIEAFVMMTAENAEQLSHLTEEYRKDPAWLARAVSEDAEVFRKSVIQVKANIAGVTPKEMRVRFSLPLFEGQRDVIETGIEQFMAKHSIRDKGTALEWMIMEITDRQTFLDFLRRELPLLKSAIRENGSSKDALENHVLAIGNLLKTIGVN